MDACVTLRAVAEDDVAEFFAHQADPVANEMAAFPARERAAFDTHWRKIIADDAVWKRTIVVDGAVAGNVACYEQDGTWLVGYWLGRDFWGRGIATEALAAFVAIVPHRPLRAFVAKRNVGSIRVLEKCGFTVAGESRSPVATGSEPVEEFVYVLE
jgi:RimJ/RimL family protein N-acetyltransferase